MKEISVTQSDLLSSRLITEPCACAKLYHRLPIAFALASPETDEIYFGFESSALARILEDSPTKIYDIRVVEVKVKVGFRAQKHTEIHLSTDIGKHIAVASHERVYRYEQSYAKIPVANTDTLLTPTEAWGLSTHGYRSRILITERMAAYIDVLANHKSQDHIVHILWREYQLELDKFAEPLNPTIVDGEFTTFTAFKRDDEFVVFDYA